MGEGVRILIMTFSFEWGEGSNKPSTWRDKYIAFRLGKRITFTSQGERFKLPPP
jgi:hypothetical protein